MNVAQWGDNRRWLVSAAAALAMLAALVTLVRVPAQPPLQPRSPVKAAIQLGTTGGGDVALTDQAAMHDPMPLFLPTERNVSARPPAAPEAGQAMLDRDARKLAFGSGTLALSLPAPVEAPRGVVDVLTMDPSPRLFGLGQVDRPPPSAEARGGFVEVLAAGTDRRVLAEVIPAAARPPTDRPWRPVEILALIDAGGLALTLSVTERSGVDEVDNYFKTYLVQNLRIGDRLGPGSYRIVIGP